MLIAIYLIACVVGAFIPAGPKYYQLPETEIVLAKGPIHFDIFLPLTPEVRAEFEFIEEFGVPVSHPDAKWLIVGWGAKTFYTQFGGYSDVTIAGLWRGISGDAGVLRFDVAGDLPSHPDLYHIGAGPQILESLTRQVLSEVSGGAPLPVAGFTATDVFWPAKTRFHIFRTCNVWVGQQLRQAGYKFGAWTPTPFSVRLAMWWHQLGVPLYGNGPA